MSLRQWQEVQTLPRIAVRTCAGREGQLNALTARAEAARIQPSYEPGGPPSIVVLNDDVRGEDHFPSDRLMDGATVAAVVCGLPAIYMNLDVRQPGAERVQRAVFGDDMPDLRKYDPRRLNPGAVVRDAIMGADEPVKPVSMTKEPPANSNGSHGGANGTRPRPRPRPRITYDDDAT